MREINSRYIVHVFGLFAFNNEKMISTSLFTVAGETLDKTYSESPAYKPKNQFFWICLVLK